MHYRRPRVRDEIVAETRGNPLALLELPRGMTAAQLAGGFGLPRALGLSASIEESFRGRAKALPPEARRLLLLAAAETLGDPVLLWRAARRLGISAAAAAPMEDAGLIVFGAPVRFRHPLVRSAVYQSSSAQERRDVHAALAEATDPELYPDRRAWHRAQATLGPDEDVAAELERSAGRAQARGGLAAAVAFLERSVLLTPDPVLRAERTLAAALANLQAGAFDSALELLAAAEAGPLDGFASARADLLRGQIAFATGLGSDAPPQLLKAAKRLEPFDLDTARDTYLGAWGAALFAGRLAGAGDLAEVSRAALDLPRPEKPRALDLLLEGLALLISDGRAAAAPKLRQAARTFASADVPVEERLRWGWLAHVAAAELWDEDTWHAITVRQTRVAREVGSLDQLALDLNSQAMTVTWRGEELRWMMLGCLAAGEIWDNTSFTALVTKWVHGAREYGLFTALAVALNYRAWCESQSGLLAAAGMSCAEEKEISTAIQNPGVVGSPGAGVLLWQVWSGQENEARATAAQMTADSSGRSQGAGLTHALSAMGLLEIGLGNYKSAEANLLQVYEEDLTYLGCWSLPDLVEAASRTGHTDLAQLALDRLSERAVASGTDWALGLLARSRALLARDRDIEVNFQQAIDRLQAAEIPTDLARARLAIRRVVEE